MSRRYHFAPFVKRWWPALCGVIAVVLARFLANRASLVENLYARGIYPVIDRVVTFLFGWVPFSVTEIAIYFLLALGFITLALVILRKLRLATGLFYGVNITGFLVAWFYVGWGFNYFRQPLMDRLALPKVAADSLVLRNAVVELTEAANTDYFALDSLDATAAAQAVTEGYDRLAGKLAFVGRKNQNRPKTLFGNWLLNKTMTSGFFSPFFHEVHLNADLLPVEYPFTLAHERAHQYGIANEAEASFIAYLVCRDSPDPALRYSCSFSLLIQSLTRARLMLSDYVTLRARVNPKIFADYQKVWQRWQRNAGRIADFSVKTYDQYLKANKIREGIANYAGVVDMVAWWYWRGGSGKIEPKGGIGGPEVGPSGKLQTTYYE